MNGDSVHLSRLRRASGNSLTVAATVCWFFAGCFFAPLEARAGTSKGDPAGLKLRAPRIYKFRNPRIGLKDDLNFISRHALVPTQELLKKVEAGANLEVENPDTRPRSVTRTVEVDLRPRMEAWIKHRDAHALPLQVQAEKVRATNYPEYARLNDQALRISRRETDRQFTPLGLTLGEAGVRIAHRRPIISVPVTEVVQPPRTIPDYREPAAKIVIDAAKKDPAYRQRLTQVLASPVKMAFLCADSYEGGHKRDAVDRRLHDDLMHLLAQSSGGLAQTMRLTTWNVRRQIRQR